MNKHIGKAIFCLGVFAFTGIVYYISKDDHSLWFLLLLLFINEFDDE